MVNRLPATRTHNQSNRFVHAATLIRISCGWRTRSLPRRSLHGRESQSLALQGRPPEPDRAQHQPWLGRALGDGRVATADVPIPFGPPMEEFIEPTAAKVVSAVRSLLA